ncbi:hypothetical protein, partial [Aromatoleum aromaticum]
MNGVYLTAAELEALQGCGPLAITAYLRLRSWMDLKSGVVGLERTISRHALLMYAETNVPRGAGMQVIKPTVKELRCALDRLERAGLVKRIGNDDLLVFKLPMAQTLSLAQIKQGRVRADSEGREQGREQGRAKPSNGEGLWAEQGAEQGREQDRGKNAKQGRYQRSESKPSTPQAAYTPANGVDADSAVAAFGSARNPKVEADEAVMRRAKSLAGMVRQKGGSVAAMDSRVLQWAREGVTEAQVGEAMRLARARRDE